MLRKTLVSLAVASALHLSSVHALELGELTAISKVNEPFKAEIQLLDVNSLTPKDIIVQLGSESEFRQAEVIPNRILSRLKFQTRKESNGNIVVDVVSLVPLDVNELDFVLSAKWPNGKVVRKYNVPLAEPVLAETKDSQKIITASSVAKAVDVPSVKETVELSDPESLQDVLNSLPTNGTRTIKQGNTLWSVANTSRPEGQLTIYQTMMAIQALNQNAFYADNVNLMKEGAILRLPTKEQISLFNAILAKKEFDQQTQTWKNLKNNGRIAAEIEAAQLNTQANSKPAAKIAPTNEDVLSLIASASVLPEEQANSNETNEAAKATIAELETKLSATEENLDKETREKAELGGQLQELNDQLSTLGDLIALKDVQLAELQQQFEAAQNALQEQKNTVDQLLEADQLRREKELEEANTLLNNFLTNPLYLSITSVLLMLLGIMLGLLLRRGGKKNDPKNYMAEDDLSDFSLSNSTAQTAAAMAAVAAPQTSNEDVDDDPFAFDFDTPNENPEDLNTEHDSDVADDDFDEIESDFGEIEELGDDDDLDFDFDMDDGEDLEEVNSDDFDTDDDIPTIDESVDEAEAPILDESDIEDSLPDEPIVNEMEDLDEPIIDEMDDLDEPIIDEMDSDDDVDFVSNLLDDSELQDDPDESALFEVDPSASLANSIEETLSESMGEEFDADIAMPAEFTAEEAGVDAEESDEEEDIDFFDASGDEVATKLDLARAYVDMGDEEGAKVILDDVLEIGSEKQISEAKKMIDRMSPSE